MRSCERIMEPWRSHTPGNPRRLHVILLLLCCGSLATAQQASREPHLGYVYPAGGQQGTSVEITIGGQNLRNVNGAYISGDGAQATVTGYARPMSQQEVNALREKLQDARARVAQARQKREDPGPGGYTAMFNRLAEESGVDAEQLKALERFMQSRSDPKRMLNRQLAETVTVQLALDSSAEPGLRELRLLTPQGLSNPVWFMVGQLPEYIERDPDELSVQTEDLTLPLPLVINGRIMPGDVDRFRFKARRGQRLLVSVSARELMPYLADAVPGWFQAVVTLYDGQGNVLAQADDYHFNPDPVLFHPVAGDGEYIIEIHDAIHRGREDFVYRLTIGELPFISGIFPLGAREGEPCMVQLTGWNLPASKLGLGAAEGPSPTRAIQLEGGGGRSNIVHHAVDDLPHVVEREPNDKPQHAMAVEWPLIVNGRIGHPGDIDVFLIRGRAGAIIVAEVTARRLNSPLDSLLSLADAQGQVLAVNDDHEDLGAGRHTHHADSYLSFALPADGEYYLRLTDARRQGGIDHAYRLRISAPRPDFTLRVVPSGLSIAAGGNASATVHVVRRDGFEGDIDLTLAEAPPGFKLSETRISADKTQAQIKLIVPANTPAGLHRLTLEGSAVIDGQTIRRSAAPAEDMMQAFIYRHLMPTSEWLVAVNRRRPR